LKLNDHKTLKRIVFNDPDPDVQEEATKRISDQTSLCEIAYRSNAVDIQLSAVERLNDKDCLKKLARGKGIKLQTRNAASLKLFLLDPAISGFFRDVRLHYKLNYEDYKYKLTTSSGKNIGATIKREIVEIKVLTPSGDILFESLFMGKEPGIEEEFREDRTFKINRAEIDFSSIYAGLLKTLTDEEIAELARNTKNELLAKSANKILKARIKEKN
jgi:hypothetical protein